MEKDILRALGELIAGGLISLAAPSIFWFIGMSKAHKKEPRPKS